jgi:hypothetical protein
LVICLGATSFAHAESQPTESEITSCQVEQTTTAQPENTCHHYSDDRQTPVKSHHINLGVEYSIRYSHSARDNNQQSKPDYQVVIEIPAPLAPTLTKGYVEPFTPTLSWMLHSAHSASRLSGWKESNLLYTQHTHFIHLV